jgi:hypothetical protein
MSLYTTLLGLFKSEPDEPWSREMLNNNADLVDMHAIGLLFAGVPLVNYEKSAMVMDSNGMPQSQAFTGPNGLVGSTTWSWNDITVTITYSITSPVTRTETITASLDNFAEVGVAT